MASEEKLGVGIGIKGVGGWGGEGGEGGDLESFRKRNSLIGR